MDDVVAMDVAFAQRMEQRKVDHKKGEVFLKKQTCCVYLPFQRV